MRLLLDTHTLLWALREPDRLSPTARAALEDPDNQRLVSPATAYEIAFKDRLGKLEVGAEFLQLFGPVLERLRAEQLPLTVRDALVAGQLPLEHRDPFDRLLAAQALVHGIPLVTADPRLAALGAETLW